MQSRSRLIPSRGAARRCAEAVDAARAAGRQHRGMGRVGFHAAGLLVECIDAPDAAGSGISDLVPTGDEIDARTPGQQRDVGMGFGGLQQRLLNRPAGGVIDVNNAAVGMAAFAREMEFVALHVERYAQIDEPLDGMRCTFDNKLDCLAAVEAGACDHGVADVFLESVAFVEHGGDSALGPGRRSACKRALGKHDDLVSFGERERCRESGCSGADYEDIEGLSVVRVRRHRASLPINDGPCKILRRDRCFVAVPHKHL